MKISIITPSLNQAQYIEDTILSIQNQSYRNFEHIIIDGGSIDGTIEILKKHPHLKWISEKDTGQSNAINKGFKMASGEIIAWLNSDDYYEKDIFIEIVKYFTENPDCFFLYGDITYVDMNKKYLYLISGDRITYENLVRNPDIVRQPSSFWRREIFDTIGYLNEDLHLVMDFDFILRIGKRYSFHYIKRNVSFFRSYQEGKTSKFQKKQLFEIYKIMKNYSRSFNILFVRFIFRRLFEGVKQRVKRMMKIGALFE